MAARPRFSPVTHVIFDNDGTLMDSENIFANATNNVLLKFGHTFTYEMKLKYMGKTRTEIAKSLINRLNLPISKMEFMKMLQAIIKTSSQNVKLMPGVRDLLLHLHEYRINMAIATSSSRAAFDIKARPHCRLMPVFHHVVCGDDPELMRGRGKPKPDIFFLAASRFNPPPRPENCLVFEDSPIGLRAGVAAGMQVIMTPDPRLPLVLRKGATQVLGSMADFDPQDFGLPAYDCCSKFEFG
ncbi:pseudouridine-5'-phosphatase [Drosophila tropicalis]|uniref:pseudouridine-5'-phosphatase n=1 Tax=Drosophila tropicalis TaxID=46794 RepID=UPI0035AB8DF9